MESGRATLRQRIWKFCLTGRRSRAYDRPRLRQCRRGHFNRATRTMDSHPSSGTACAVPPHNERFRSARRSGWAAAPEP